MKENIRSALEEFVVRTLQDASNENNAAERGYLISDACRLLDKLSEDEKLRLETLDKEERRNLEAMKNETLSEIEKEKAKISWKKVLFEMSKLLGPVIITMLGYDIFQRRILRFEETGRIASTAGRELHLPRFMK